MQSTLSLFRRWQSNLPTLFPRDRYDEIVQAIKRLEDSPSSNVQQIEDAMGAYSYETWPWHQAKKSFWKASWEK